jgi:hypothetical protein
MLGDILAEGLCFAISLSDVVSKDTRKAYHPPTKACLLFQMTTFHAKKTW